MPSHEAANAEVERLKARLPAPVAERLASLRFAEGRATLVLDVSGLDPAAREGLEAQTTAALEDAPGVLEVRVAMTADRASQPRRRIIAVGSGKGGVGKSTVATNLAVALHRAGHKVGLVDADIYGPSQARLLGTEGLRPIARDKPEGGSRQLIPVESSWGVPVLSMAHLAEPGQAIAWRGPMAGNALVQMLEGDWTDVEVLVVDLPPGTGDIQLTMLQRFKPDGAVIVSTPQDLALIDATRAIALFDKGGVPVIGLVENMAGYACPHCGEVSDPFGHGGAETAAIEHDYDFLGRIPLDIAIRRESDAGTPPAAGEGPQAAAFAQIAGKVADWIAAR